MKNTKGSSKFIEAEKHCKELEAILKRTMTGITWRDMPSIQEVLIYECMLLTIAEQCCDDILQNE